MGRQFSQLFLSDGLEVAVAGPTEAKGKKAQRELGVRYIKDNKAAAMWAELVIITVPIEKTAAVIKEIAPVMKEGSCLMDFTSVKVEPCKLMRELAPEGVQVIGGHPVFGPSITDFKGENFILCNVKSGDWLTWMETFLKSKGFSVTLATPEEHDEIMGVVQSLTHLMLFSAGKTLKDLKTDMGMSRKFASPVYNLILDLVGRILAQDPKMYYQIQVNNKEAKRVRKAFLDSVKAFDSIVKTGDEAGFVKEAQDSAKAFGDVSESLKRTDRILKEEL